MILTKSKNAVNTFSSPGELFRPGLFYSIISLLLKIHFLLTLLQNEEDNYIYSFDGVGH